MSDCVYFNEHKNRDYTKLYKKVSESRIMEVEKKSGVRYHLLSGYQDNFSLGAICALAVFFNCRIPDLVDYKE